MLNLRSFSRWFFLTLILFSATTYAKAGLADFILSLGQGDPAHMGKELGPTSYVEVETQRLTKAKVAWVNWDYFAEAGFDVGDRVITPEIEQALLESFAWGVPGDSEPADAFAKNRKKIFRADRYGGDGLAGNMGSGRAASAGKVQIKGIGKTSLVTAVGGHSSGTANLAEAIGEAIYGEVGQALPLKANRVLVILDRGTDEVADGRIVNRNALIVREDPLRPASYMRNLWGRGPYMQSEEKRTQEALTYILKGFPVPENLKNAAPSKQIRGALLLYADHVAAQFAAAFALKIYHAATSPSNIESSGRFLDYGTMTTVPDYGKLRMLQNNDAFGDIVEFRNVLMLEVIQNIRSELPAPLAVDLPSDQELGDHFTASYRSFVHREFLRLTGLSLAEAIRLEKLPASWKLTDILLKIAAQDGVPSEFWPGSTPKLTKYDLNKILIKLAGAQSLNPTRLAEAIQGDLDDGPLKQNLIRTYADVLSRSPMSFASRLSEAQKRNASHPETYRWNLYPRIEKIVGAYRENKSALEIQTQFQDIIRSYGPNIVRSCRDVLR